MFQLSIFVLLMTVSERAFTEPSIENAWHCKTTYDVGEFQNVIDHHINFDSNGKYSFSTSISFVDTNSKKSELLAFVDGDYSFQNDLLEYKNVKNVDIQIKSDELNILTSGSIDELKDMLKQNSDSKYATLKLSNEIWISQDSVSGEKITCFKKK
ncbi:hypothetical protein OPS25_15280 [Alteromonas ponticola]|uniref:Uncharacterized protein n=1 Tax=Alteromonas aquimaris TaxID=2998417 RepID=A0ABT3PAR3_9ALTE|nr:hypothetical protein [Alteromonas aquimaris]MCW8109868.1 hypothetical protein [Alteromonas aquimaris]